MRGLLDRLRNLSPEFYGRFHAGAAIFFAAQIPVVVGTALGLSVRYVNVLSLWALVAAHWAAWQSVQAQKEERERDSGKGSSPESGS